MQVKDNLVSGAIFFVFFVVSAFLFTLDTHLASGTLPVSVVAILKGHYLLPITVLTFLFSGVVSGVLYRVARRHRHTNGLLSKMKDQYHRVVHHAGIGIAVTQDGMLKYANPRLSLMLGYPPEGPFPRPFIDYIHPTYRETVIGRYQRSMSEGRIIDSSMVVQITDSRGEGRWVEASGVIIEWDGKPAILHFLRDISEEKKAKKALERSEQVYRSLVENLNDVVFILDNQGDIIYISPVIEPLSGFATRAIIGRNFRKFVHPDDLAAMEKGFLDNVGRDIFCYEFRALDSLDAVHHVRVSCRITMKDIAAQRITGILTDISDYKRAEEALMISEKRYRELVENLNDVIFVLDGKGNFKFVNGAVERIGGYKPEELIDRYYREYVTERSYQRIESLSEELYADHNIDIFEVELFGKNGDIRVIECRMTPLWENNVIVEFHVIGRDITENTKMTRWLTQAEKLSRLGGILSGVAHELSNPLSAILGNAQLLVRKDLPPEIREKLTVIEKESRRSTKIIGGLLSFARDNKPERAMANINDVLMESYQLMEYELRVNNVAIEMDLDPHIPVTSVDKGQIQQIFINLITNAHHALAEKGGGTLSIRTYHREEKLFIEFVDDGPGIARENLQRIFEPFFTTKEPGKGTGLGLSIVHGIIQDHGGTIEARSEPDKGAVFIVALPIIGDAQSGEAPEMTGVGIPGGRFLVLVVDDEKSVRDFIAETLEEGGYLVMTAEDGNGAMALIEEHEFAAIVSNMKMPGLSGEDLYLSIRQKDPGLADRLIISTGDILNERTREFLKKTGNRFIEKPFEIDRLLAIVGQAVSDKVVGVPSDSSPK